jgi:ABC-type phosphate transport system auxiliary subunit
MDIKEYQKALNNEGKLKELKKFLAELNKLDDRKKQIELEHNENKEKLLIELSGARVKKEIATNFDEVAIAINHVTSIESKLQHCHVILQNKLNAIKEDFDKLWLEFNSNYLKFYETFKQIEVKLCNTMSYENKVQIVEFLRQNERDVEVVYNSFVYDIKMKYKLVPAGECFYLGKYMDAVRSKNYIYYADSIKEYK